MKKPFINPIVFYLLLMSLLIMLFSCTNKESNYKVVTINALDERGDLIGPIHVWDNYDTRRKIVDKVMHNEKVKMIRRVGDGVLIRTNKGKEGWVTYFFIKEFVNE